MKIKRTIRNLDQELYNQARVQALKEGKPIGDWLNEVIITSLNFEEEASTWARENGWTEPR